MKNLLNKFYEDVISNEPDVIKMNCRMDDEIKNIIKNRVPDSDKLPEDIRDTYFDVAFLAQRQGFILGMRYAVKLLMELLSD